MLQLNNIVVAFGGPPVLDGVNLVIERGDRLCLLGRNGSGKTTLLKVIQGLAEPDDGEVVRESGLRVATLEQHVPADMEGTVLDVVLASCGDERAARTAISRIGLDPEATVGDLSAGLRRRTLLARAVATEPDLLLLDEPTNHLDVDSIAWLEEFLRRQATTLLFVTHDRTFLRKLSTGILDIDRGRLSRFDADYDRYLDRRQASLEAEARSEALFDKRLAAEEVWIRRGVRERRKRNQGRVKKLGEMRGNRQARRDLSGTARITAQSAERSGRLVLQTKGVAFDWEGLPIARDLTTTVMRGDRVGIIGPNGSGKTTLLRLLLGELEPDAGEIRHGTNLKIAYFDQLHRTLDENATAIENVGQGASTVMVNGRELHVIGYLRNFLFSADQARSPIRLFSGGERNRLLLARLFARPSNVLVLDEPTNDLDVETLEVLEVLLAEYEGTVLVVSHDRALLDHVVTSTFVLEGDGVIGEYAGGYSDWVAQRKDVGGAKEPKRGKRKRPAKPSRVSPLDRDEKKELRDLPARIESLETELAALHEQMADPSFFKQDGNQIAAARSQVEQLGAEIATAYARWEALEAKRATAS